MSAPALPLLLGSGSSSAALLGQRKCDSSLRFEEDDDGFNIIWYPGLELDGSDDSCKPDLFSPRATRSWRLVRQAFGPDASFHLDSGKVGTGPHDIIRVLGVRGVRFGQLEARSLEFWFLHDKAAKGWSVELRTAMWTVSELKSQPLDFKELSVEIRAADSKRTIDFNAGPDLGKSFRLETDGGAVAKALKSVFADDLQARGALRLALTDQGIWHLLPAEPDPKKPRPRIGLPDGKLMLPKGIGMAWFDSDTATKTRSKEDDPVFLAWGEVGEDELVLGRTAELPRITLRVQAIPPPPPPEQKQASAAPNAAAAPAAASASAASSAHAATGAPSTPATAASAPGSSSAPVATTDSRPTTPADLSKGIEPPKPPRWQFMRRDWSLPGSGITHPAGVSTIRAAWAANVVTAAGKFGPLCITEGVLRRDAGTRRGLRFAGRLQTTPWELSSRIGRLFVQGWSGDGSAIDPTQASARTHRPLMTFATRDFDMGLSSLDVPLLLLRCDLAPADCDFSEFNFAPTGLRAVHDKDPTKAKADLRAADSYLWLGDAAAIGELPLAHIDLTRARIDVARSDDLVRLGFLFAGLHLDISKKQAWIVDTRASCRVRQRVEPAGTSDPLTLDTRPVLVAEFPPQHVFEEALFRPGEAPLPDVTLDEKDNRFKVTLREQEQEFSTSLPLLLQELDRVDCRDHEAIRREYAKKKSVADPFFSNFFIAFEKRTRPITAGEAASAPKGETPVDAATCATSIEHWPPAYWVYIGADRLPPDLMAIAREVHNELRTGIVAELLDRALRRARRLIALLRNEPPTLEDSETKLVDLAKAIASLFGVFKEKINPSFPKRDLARLLEQAAAGAMQDYAYFRDFYAEWMLKEHGRDHLFPDDMEFFSSNNREGLELKYDQQLETRFNKALAEYILLLQGTQDPLPIMRARLSGVSRLAFHVDCGSRPGMDVEDGDAHLLPADDSPPGTRLPFSFDALTDWAHYDLAVTPRARQAAAFDDAGVLIRRDSDEAGINEDDSPSADISMLRSLGIRSGQLPARRQGAGRTRDWGKQLRTLHERLSDVEASLSVVPNDLQTSLEIPARLILSPSQKAQWRTRRGKLDWPCSTPTGPVPLWTAALDVDAANPLVRAVASPDLRPEFVRFGLERRLFGYQQAADKDKAIHAPVGGAPPRGPRAPWTLGFEESDPNTSSIDRLFSTTQSDTSLKPPTEQEICAISAAQAAPSASGVVVRDLHPLVDYLCIRRDERERYLEHARFRSTLDAYDRHEIVLLSSAWGLPVRGRREKTGQLQAQRFSSQVELPEEWRLLDAQAGTAIYRPRALKVQELALTALGGTLRHDSDFIPPAAARHLVHGPLFDSFSVERWQHWTVLGRDVFAEVVYKGYLFPIGHRASLVKQTERVFLCPPPFRKGGSTGPVRCYLRQRMFIRVARPEKTFPAYGQPNGGRMFPTDMVRMLTTTTPDIVDPAEDVKEMSGPSPAGRMYANRSGLVFWPRTARVTGADVVFDMQIQGAPTRAKLLFVDNTAVNQADLMDRLVDYYNHLPSPDIQAGKVFLQAPDPRTHLRTLDLRGQSLRYCDEIKPGSASHKTLFWTLKATGGVGHSNIVRDDSNRREEDNKFEGPVLQFDDPLLEGADQPPFFPAIETARIRVDQVERLTGGTPQAAVAQFEGWYVRNGFDADKNSKETDPLEIYANIVSRLTMDMGDRGDRSGGVMRPGGEVIALSRQRGPLTGTDPVELAGKTGSVLKGEKGFPVLPPKTPTANKAFSAGDDKPPSAPKPDAVAAFTKFFGGKNDVLKTKILGLVSVSDLVKYLKVSDAAAELPLLREVVEYGLGGAQATAAGLRTTVIAPLYELVLELDRQWQAAGKGAQEKLKGIVGGMEDIFPDVHNALQDLKRVLSPAAKDGISDATLFASLSDIHECGRRLMDACGRVASNPLDHLQVAVKNKVQGLSAQIEKFLADLKELKLAELTATVKASFGELEKRLDSSAFAWFDKLVALTDKLIELTGAEQDAAVLIKAVRQILEDARSELPKLLQAGMADAPTADRAPLLQAQDVVRRQLNALETAIGKASDQLRQLPQLKSKAAVDLRKQLLNHLAAAQRLTADARDSLAAAASQAPSPYRTAVTNLALLLRLESTLRKLGGDPQVLAAQVSQVLSDHLALQVGPRLQNLPSLEQAKAVFNKVLAPIKDGAEAAIEDVADTDLSFLPLPQRAKGEIFRIPSNWPVKANTGSIVDIVTQLGHKDSLLDHLHAVAFRAAELVKGPKLAGDKFQATREQLGVLGDHVLEAEVKLHLAAVGVVLVARDLVDTDEKNILVTKQRIDAVFRELERIGDQAVTALATLRDDLGSKLLDDVRDTLQAPARTVMLAILDWFAKLNRLLANELRKLDPGDEFLQRLMAPWTSLLEEYRLAIDESRTFVEKKDAAQWAQEPSRLLPALRNPNDIVQAVGAQAVFMAQRALTDMVTGWLTSLVVPADKAVGELLTAFRPVVVLLEKGYAALAKERLEIFKSSEKTVAELLTLSLLVVVDRNTIFSIGKEPSPQETDASTPDKDQLHWDLQSMRNLIGDGKSEIASPHRLAALQFMDYFARGWQTGQATPLRIVNQVKRLSLEELKSKLLSLINFNAIREEIEERIKMLIPSAVTMSYDFSTTMMASAEKATAGVFRPKEGCALSVRTRARIDLLKMNTPPSFLSIGEMGAFDIRLLGSFDAVTLHFKGVRFSSSGGAPKCDLQYDGFTIGKELDYLRQLTPFFGSKPGSGFYLQPLSSGIGLEAGYGLNLGAFTVGNFAIFNVSLNAAARLPFDNRGATFVASLSRRDSPFTIAVAPYGGSGYFALEADTKGIVGFEASFEYGGAGAFAYGPLTGTGRLMVGAYIRSRRDHTEIFATFYVGGSASIWIFNFGASLYVCAKHENGRMVGSATYTFSFSMGIVDYDYKVGVNVDLSLDGRSKGESDSQADSVTASWHDETRPLQLAALDRVAGVAETVHDVAWHPLSGMAVAATAATPGQCPPEKPSAAQRQIKTKCQTQCWASYSRYFDRDLSSKVIKKGY